MFDTDPRDLAATLSQMEHLARERTNFNQVEAKEKFKEFVRRDRRFDEYNADALVARVTECKSHGAVLDLDDPRLKGLPPRPLEKNYW